MPSPCLKEFIATVPSCTQKTDLGEVLDIFEQSNCDRLVVVSEEERPLGVLHLSNLLPYLRGGKVRQRREAAKAGTKKQLTRGKSPHPSPNNLQQPLSELGLSIISPVATLPGDFTLKQFWPYLEEESYKTGKSQDYTLVNVEGKFIGLLDIQRLLKFLTALSPAVESDLAAGKKAAATQANEKNIDSQLEALNPLLQFLERLPLPVMLQTSSGQSVRRNLAWRQHFDLLQDPEWLRREIADLLETGSAEEQEKLKNEIHPGERVSVWEDKDRGRFAAPASSPKLCYVGATPDTCTCVCPMQNGSERVWQFVKIPLGNVLSGQDLSWTEEGTKTEPLEDEPSVDNFRLATFGPSTDSSHVATAKIAKEYQALRTQFQALKSQYQTLKTQLQTINKTNKPYPKPLCDRLGDSGAMADLWLVLAQDITESDRAAKELTAKNADLIQLNRLKDEFLACISHELKTPLTAILGLSSLLKDRVLGEMNDRQARYARLIHQSGRHLMTVVNDILDLTRMETGQLELMLAPVEILAVCDRAYQQARQMHLSKKNSDPEELNPQEPETRFTLSIETGLDNLIADEMRLRQMLVHLLSNALKFTDIDGEIGLRVSYWEGWIAFTVWDTGIGIPEDKQHLIFQKFQQLENPLTRQFDGTGLGLVLTQRLARLHGGDVSFTSKPGSGSQFTLLLPPCPPQTGLLTAGSSPVLWDWELAGEEPDRQTSFPTPNFSVPNPESRLMLVVESTLRLVEDLTDRLTSLGYRVVIARSGTEALEKARRLQPSTIFLNPLLPMLSGWDVLTLLKASAQTQHIPVIVTASWAEKEYAYGKRADGFLTLPVQPDSLRESLEKLTSPKEVSKKRVPAKGLTILRLSMSEKSLESVVERKDSASNSQEDLSSLLHQRNYRVLEADDLVQAELLARIWQPDIVLLEGQIANPLTYLEQLSEHQALASLPLVTLDEATTQAALQVGNREDTPALQVFPCLGDGTLPEPSTLLQAIEVAAGISCKVSILVVDVSTLPDLHQPFESTEESKSGGDSFMAQAQNMGQMPKMAADNKKRSECLQALIQYLQTAGLRVVIGRSWEEVLRQAQHCSVDLLLIDLGDSMPNSGLVNKLRDLRKLAQKPPTLVRGKLAEETKSEEGFTWSMDFLRSVLAEVATLILPASLSMDELLEQILHTLMRSSSTSVNYPHTNVSSVAAASFRKKFDDGRLPSRWS